MPLDQERSAQIRNEREREKAAAGIVVAAAAQPWPVARNMPASGELSLWAMVCASESTGG